MNAKSTRVLVLLAVGLFAYIYFFERHQLSPQKRAEAANRLLADFDPARINSVEIGSGTNQIIRVERTNDSWQMTVPVVCPANSTAIEAFLSTLALLPRQATVSARDLMREPGGASAFGLEPPRARVALEAGNDRFEFRIGGQVPLASQIYFQRVGHDGVEVTDGSIVPLLPVTAENWRDRTLASMGTDAFDRLTVQSGNAYYELRFDPTNRLWSLTQPVPVRANSDEVEAALLLLKNARINAFVSDSPKPDLETFGLAPPQLELNLGRGSNNLWGIKVGASPADRPDQVYMRVFPQANVVLTDKAVFEAFRPRLPASQFRDTRLLSPLPASVSAVEVRGRENFTVLRQGNDAWHVAKPYDYDADPVLVRNLFNALASLQIAEFDGDVVTDFAQFGFTTNSRQYTITAAVTNVGVATNLMAAQIQFGGTNQATANLYVRRTDETSVYGLKPIDVLQLPQAAFELRDRRIWNFSTNDVASITITIKDKTRRLTRNPSGQWTCPGVEFVTGALVDEAVFRLGHMTSAAWVARGKDRLEPLGFGKAAHQVAFEIKRDDKTETLTLQFGKLSPFNNPFGAITLEGEPTVFLVPSELYDPYELLLRELNLTPAVQ